MKTAQMHFKSTILFLFIVLFLGCYSFQGISIPPEIETYDMPFVEVRTGDAPVGVNQDFQQRMIDKISRESRLSLDSDNPDIIISCAITSYSIDPVSPTSNDVVESNKLTISIDVSYEDSTNEENNWNKKFTKNEQFPSSTNFQSVQEQLNEEIFDLLVEDIFNHAFTNW